MSEHEPLVVDNLVRRFGGRAALDGASFSLREGECLALLGPNGAGKTTLIRSIAGRLKPDSGQVLNHGQLQQPGGLSCLSSSSNCLRSHSMRGQCTDS